MRVTEVKYTKKFNLGNYESEEIGLVAVLEEDENHLGALSSLKSDVAAAYGGETGEEVPEQEEEVEVEEEAPKKEKKSKKVEEPVEEEEAEEPEEVEEEVEEEEEKPVKKSKFKKKAQTYDRGNETHKEIYSNLLKSVAPDWKKTPESKAKGKSVSAKMEGEEFLDAEGEVLPEFKDTVKKLMKAKK